MKSATHNQLNEILIYERDSAVVNTNGQMPSDKKTRREKYSP